MTRSNRDELINDLVPSRLLKKPGNGPKRHTGRDEVEIRYPVNYCFFWIPDSRFAPSGMTDLMLVLKIFSLAACQLLSAGCLMPRLGVTWGSWLGVFL